MSDLSLVSIDDMLNEMDKRYDALIFYGVKDKYKSADDDDYLIHCHGGSATCMGLSILAQDALSKNHIDKLSNEFED